MMWLIAACNDGGQVVREVLDAGVQIDARQPAITPFGHVPEPFDDAEFLFDEREVRTFALELAEEDLAFLDNDPVAETYVAGTLRFRDEVYRNVGIRYKGSAGAFVRCTSGRLPPSGPKTCVKLSMKVKLNYSDPEGNFYGLRKLQFHSMNSDSSLLRERLGYWLFRQFGIPASRTAPVRLLVNGRLAGVFLLVEQIDGRFTRSRFIEGGRGNLYKEIWPIHQDPQLYKNALRTNEDENPSVESMIRLEESLRNADEAELANVVRAWSDPNYMAKYLAVDRALANDDGFLQWYCGVPLGQGNNPGECGNHNYYWYEEQQADRLWLVPWDLDLTLEASPFVRLLTPWNEIPESCQPVRIGLFTTIPSSCDALIRGFAGFRDEFHAAVGELLAGPFADEQVDRKLSAWEAQLRPHVEEAARQDNRHVQVGTWEEAISRLRDTISSRREILAAQL